MTSLDQDERLLPSFKSSAVDLCRCGFSSQTIHNRMCCLFDRWFPNSFENMCFETTTHQLHTARWVTLCRSISVCACAYSFLFKFYIRVYLFMSNVGRQSQEIEKRSDMTFVCHTPALVNLFSWGAKSVALKTCRGQFPTKKGSAQKSLAN